MAAPARRREATLHDTEEHVRATPAVETPNIEAIGTGRASLHMAKVPGSDQHAMDSQDRHGLAQPSPPCSGHPGSGGEPTSPLPGSHGLRITRGLHVMFTLSVQHLRGALGGPGRVSPRSHDFSIITPKIICRKIISG